MFGNRRFIAGSVSGAALAFGVIGGSGWISAQAVAREVNPPASPVAPAVAPPSFANLIARVAPAVVSIDVVRPAQARDIAYQQGDSSPFQFFFGSPGGKGGDDGDASPFPGFPGFPAMPRSGAPMKEQATGSGFFISPDGYIVTNNHVVEGATSITVRLADQRQFKAHLVGRDPATDLAVVKVDGGGFTYVNFEQQAKPRVGDWVVAVGNPYDLGGTATAGIVSALARPNVSGSGFVDYMQIDAPINKGNSGGPTFDIYGRVVGVNSAIFSPSGGSVGIGFAIPAEVAQSVTQQLIAHGKVERGYIGATIQTVSADIAASLGIRADQGALVAQLKPGGPAAQGGLRVGDVVVGVDGAPIGTASALTQHIALVRPGQVIRLEVLRDGRPTTVDIRSGLRPAESQLASNDMGSADEDGAPGAHDSARILGMSLVPVDPDTRQQYGLGRSATGVVVEGVNNDSDAQAKGLQAGDVIVRAGDRPVATAGDVSAAVATAKRSGRASVLLLVSRNGQTIFVPVSVKAANG